MTLNTTFLPLNDGTEICAPSDLQLMTNFVLKEQGDWFEDEIHFVRKYIQPGMQALDIGANYGLYSMAIAKGLGSDGSLWCFEPTPNTAQALRDSVNKNSYENSVTVIQKGLSDHIGEATFYTSVNAELNSLSSDTGSTDGQLTIELTTLDHCQAEFNWNRLDFIKLDAEGEELKILKQAHKTLSENSPLVLFELKHGSEVNLPLINAFEELGYESFYLIPGLNILAPFDVSAPLDSYLLNLFCCKSDTANKMEESGLLVRNTEPLPASPDFSPVQVLKDIEALKVAQTRDSSDAVYQQALIAYLCSRDESLSIVARYRHLLFSFELVKSALEKGESKIERLSSYSRIAFDLGHRAIGIQILSYVIKKYLRQGTPFKIEEHFIPPGIEFESIEPVSTLEAWLCASILDQNVRKHAYSCYFSQANSLPYLDEIKRLGYLRPDMETRAQVIRARHKL